MANPSALQKKNGKYLWFALLGLGFQSDTATSAIGKTNMNIKHINLGPNMFDKPNKDAFYIVTHFLLEKLNPVRFSEAYRYCWPVLNHKADAEFRKVTCAWLREIMDEVGNAGSKVVASLFLSPGGPKFISLMLNLANHVMLQELKTFTTDDSWVPEAAAMPASSLDLAVKRLNLITARFLKTAVAQDHFLHEYQRRAQCLIKASPVDFTRRMSLLVAKGGVTWPRFLVKSVRDIRAEGNKYDELLKRHSGVSQQDEASAAEKMAKVRSLWSVIDGMLSSTKEERRAVGCVLKGDADQHVLDGTDQVLRIPRMLQERVEQLPHQLSSGNVYEAGQLNLLCVLELTNHALQLLRDERRLLSDAPRPHLNPAHLQEKRQQMARVLQNLHLIRQKISKEGLPEVRSSIRELEAEWDRKWMDTLKCTPLVSFLNEGPALGFLSPMAPLSFEPVTEAHHSVFSQFPATLLEEKPAEREPQEGDEPNLPSPTRFSPAAAKKPESPAGATEASSHANTSLDWLFDTPPSPSVRAPPAPPLVGVRKTTCAQPKVIPTRTKTQILDLECENLADQFADAVATSPTGSRVKGLDLEGLLSTLHGDPFSTRKQLPRTPESLIMDVKKSWRKALEEDVAEKTGCAVVVDDSVLGRLPPLNESHQVLDTPVSHSPSNAPVSQQGGSILRSTQLWDTVDSPSGTGSSAIQFTLDHETLPEMSSCDSLLSLNNDEGVEVKSDEDELLVPVLKTEESPLSTRHHLGLIRQPCTDGSRKRSPECRLSGHMVSSLDRNWLVEGVKPAEATDKVFSLELETLEMLTPPRKQEHSLPELITFSPIDDMKC